MPVRHVAILLLAVVVTSWSGPLVRLASDADPMAIAFWRTMIATSVLLPVALSRRKGEIVGLARKDWLLSALAALFLALHFATWIASIDLTTIASSVLLVTSVPVWVAMASVAMGQRLPLIGWIGIALGIVGGGVVTLAGAVRSESATTGNLLAIAGAITAAGYLLVGGRLRQRLSIFPYTGIVYGLCAAILGLFAILRGVELVGLGTAAWLAIIGIGIGPQLVGHTSYNYLLEHVETWKVSAAVLGEPVGSTIIAVFLFNEIPGVAVLPGGLLLLLGIWLALSARERLPAVHPVE